MLIALMLSFGEGYCILQMPIYMTKITNILYAVTYADNFNAKECFLYVMYTILFVFGSLVIDFVVRLLTTYVCYGFIGKLRKNVFKHIFSFSMIETSEFHISTLVSRATWDTKVVGWFFLSIMSRLFVCLTIMIIALFRSAFSEVKFTTSLWICAGAILVVIFSTGFVWVYCYKRIEKLLDKNIFYLQENLSGIKTIKSFNSSQFHINRLTENNKTLNKYFRVISIQESLVNVAIFVFTNILSMLIYYFAALNFHPTDDQSVGFGNATGFSMMTSIVISYLLLLVSAAGNIPNFIISTARLSRLLRTEGKIRSPKHPQNFIPEKIGSIEFENVSFKYPSAIENTVSDISFKANAGETIAFIGQTGSGKSTLVNLIPRLYIPSSGKIKVNGIETSEADLEKLRNSIGYVTQKVSIFNDTVKNNIDFMEKNLSEQEMKKIIECAGLTTTINNMPDGLETMLSENGENLSGGQKQRISIARALAIKPNFIIFDDSFSALDSRTEWKIQKLIHEEMPEVTKIIISQKISSIMNANKIYVLDKGKIIAEGKHNELIKTNPLYESLCNIQNVSGVENGK